MKKMLALMMGLLMMVSPAWALEGDSLEVQEVPMEDDRNHMLVGGWNAATDPTVTEEIRALLEKGTKDLDGVIYTPVTYLGMQVVAGFKHAILCQATVVYPEAQPAWVIVYLYEDPEGGVTVTEIRDLDW